MPSCARLLLSLRLSLDDIAKSTNGFSGADLSYIVSRSAKFAIKDSIEAAIKAQKAAEEAGEDIEMEEDPVPYITRQHFEEAMKTASRSVSDSELRRYEHMLRRSSRPVARLTSDSLRTPATMATPSSQLWAVMAMTTIFITRRDDGLIILLLFYVRNGINIIYWKKKKVSGYQTRFERLDADYCWDFLPSYRPW